MRFKILCRKHPKKISIGFHLLVNSQGRAQETAQSKSWQFLDSKN
jgi:hypothetical protein